MSARWIAVAASTYFALLWVLLAPEHRWVGGLFVLGMGLLTSAVSMRDLVAADSTPSATAPSPKRDTVMPVQETIDAYAADPEEPGCFGAVAPGLLQRLRDAPGFR